MKTNWRRRRRRRRWRRRWWRRNTAEYSFSIILLKVSLQLQRLPREIFPYSFRIVSKILWGFFGDSWPRLDDGARRIRCHPAEESLGILGTFSRGCAHILSASPEMLGKLIRSSRDSLAKFQRLFLDLLPRRSTRLRCLKFLPDCRDLIGLMVGHCCRFIGVDDVTCHVTLDWSWRAQCADNCHQAGEEICIINGRSLLVNE